MAERFDQRLVSELRDHLEDAVAAHMAAGAEPFVAEQLALADLGPLTAVAEAWEARCARRRRHNRRQLAAGMVAVVAATMLAVTQHADGHHNPSTPATVQRGPCPGTVPRHGPERQGSEATSQRLLRDLC